MMAKLGVQVCYWMLVVLLIALPWNPLLVTSLSALTSISSSALTIWKEIFLFIVLGLSTFFLLKDGHLHLLRRPLSLMIIGFCALSVVTGVLLTGDGFPQNLLQVAWGAKYGLFYLMVLLGVSWIGFSEDQRSSLLRYWMMSVGAVMAFSLLLAFVLPEDFLVNLGYLPVYGDTEAHLNAGSLSYCHKIENAITHEEFCRLQGPLSGPNQLGAYLLIVLGVAYAWLRSASSGLGRVLPAAMIGVGLLLLLLTWSRSAYIGALLGGVVIFVLESRDRQHAMLYLSLSLLGVLLLILPAFWGAWWLNAWQIPGGIGGFIIASALLLWSQWQWKSHRFSPVLSLAAPVVIGLLAWVRLYRGEFFWNIFLRPSSTQGHFERMRDGVISILDHPFGLGLGDAGPASARFADAGETGFLPESWYLQVGLESGVMGLLLFIIIMGALVWYLLRDGGEIPRGLGVGLIGLSAAALFLHTWESSVVAYSFALLAGLVLSERSHRPQGEMDKDHKDSSFRKESTR